MLTKLHLALVGTLAIASPVMAADNVQGSTSATFENAQPTNTTYTGLGTNHITWGDIDPSDPYYSVNRMSFAANSPFAARIGQQFKVGSLSYYNGTTLIGSKPDQVDLRLAMTFSDPAIGLVDNLFTLGLVSTPNTDDEDASADYIYFPSFASSTSFLIGGRPYEVRLLGFSNVVGDGFLNSTASEFHVREGGNASADLFAMVTSPVPEPSTWAMMIGGFALIGYALRRRSVAYRTPQAA